MPLYEFEGKCPLLPKSTFIHPQAVIIGNVEVGERCYIGAGAVIRGDFGKIVIGNGSNVQDNCIIHVDPETIAIIEDNVIIGHGAIIHGSCLIRENAVVGMGAIVSPGCEIGNKSILAAGSVLPPRYNVPPNRLAMGNPVNTIKNLTDKMESINKVGINHYQSLTQRSFSGLRLIEG
ncbi:MAG: gamma carbonic anhydrase family protein [Syntrophomonas sp.]